MQKKRFSQSLSLILCVVLIAAMALFAAGCGDNNDAQGNVLGEGDTGFTFTVTDAGGKETTYEILTDKDIVGDALTELGLISGEEGDYGLYVKTVDGTTLDYETDGKYWAFYVNGEYAMTGVDSTEIVEGTTYSFVAE